MRGVLLKLLLAAAVAGVGLSSVFTVRQTEQALVLQFGEHKRTVQAPGLHFKVPLIQNVVYLDKRILNLDLPPQEILSRDPKNLVVDAIARFRIVDPLLTFQTRRNEQGAGQALTTTISSIIRNVVARTEFTTLLSDQRAGLMREIRDEVNAKAAGLGVEIVDVRLRRVDLPETISQQIFEQMNAERIQQAKQTRAEGQKQAQIIRAEAERKVTVTLANAERDAQVLRGQGDSEATRIFAAAFGKDPAFFEFYRAMQAYKAALKADDTTFILSPDSDFLKFLESMEGTRR